MKHPSRRLVSAFAAVGIMAATTTSFSSRAQANDLVLATVHETMAITDLLVATTQLVTVPIFYVLGLRPHPVVAYAPPPMAAPVVVAPAGPQPFVVATTSARPAVGGYYAQ
ncbi:MAG: hypothetical protein H7829_02875 [Magnetococcus sp. THC-1_WYH]